MITANGRNVITVGERVAFAGANPVSIEHQDYFTNVESPSTSYIYSDVQNGKYFWYGSSTVFKDALVPQNHIVTFTPPLSSPVSMQPGEIFALMVVIRTSSTTATGTSAIDQKSLFRYTYRGKETVTTALGTFNSCHSTQTISPVGNDGPTVHLEKWTAADGPYRGQTLKLITSDDGRANSADIWAATQMTYAPK